MYTLPFYTESDALKSLAPGWSAEPFFSLKTTSLACSFWLSVSSQKPPVVVVGADEQLLDRGFITQLAAAVAGERSHIIAVVETTAEQLMVESLRQGADRVVSVRQCSARIFGALIKSLLPKTESDCCYAPYRLHAHGRAVFIGDKCVNVRRLVFEMANYLFVHNGAIIPRSTLLRDLWGLDDRRCETRRVEAHASLVKKQLQLDGSYGWRLRSTRGNRPGYGVFQDGSRSIRSEPRVSGSYSKALTIDHVIGDHGALIHP